MKKDSPQYLDVNKYQNTSTLCLSTSQLGMSFAQAVQLRECDIYIFSFDTDNDVFLEGVVQNNLPLSLCENENSKLCRVID